MINSLGLEWIEVLRTLSGLACLLVLMLGVRWQARTFRGDMHTHQRRMQSAFALGALSFVGIAVWVGFNLADSRSGSSGAAAAPYVFGIGFLAVAFVVKTWLGPLLLSSAASWAVYMYFQYGELRLIPIFEMLVDGLLKGAPPGTTTLYAGITLLHAALGSLYSSFAPEDLS